MNDKSDLINKCQDLEQYIKNQSFDYETELSEALIMCPSKMDSFDLLFSIAFGCLGALLDTNEKIQSFLDEIHKTSNSYNPKSNNKIMDVLAKLLKHTGDWIDKVPIVQEDGTVITKSVNRGAQEIADGVWSGKTDLPHRIFWGHDIFSLSQDNPFLLEIRQYGFWKGIIQAIRHLIADTCSKQGLPIPTSSWWDKAGEEGKRSNGLLDFCQRYAEEALGSKQKGANNKVFNHMFSIHMEDVLSDGLVRAGVWAYSEARSIEDDMRKQQLEIVAYTTNLLGSAVIGFVQTGIPKINWVSFRRLIKAFFKLIKSSNERIQLLWAKTEALFSETEGLDNLVKEKQRKIEQEIVAMLKDTDCRTEKRNRLIEQFEEA